MRTRVLRRPIVFLRVRLASVFVVASWFYWLKMFVIAFVRCSIPHCIINSNSRNSNYQCSLFSKKNPIIRIFCISACHDVPINSDKCSSTVYTRCFLQCYRAHYVHKCWCYGPDRGAWNAYAYIIYIYIYIYIYIHTVIPRLTSDPANEFFG